MFQHYKYLIRNLVILEEERLKPSVLFYYFKLINVDSIASFLNRFRLYNLSLNKFYIDEIYLVLVRITQDLIAHVAKIVDRIFIDKLFVRGGARLVSDVGSKFRAIQSGNFQLNVMLPVIAYNLLKSICLMSNSMPLLANKAIKTFKVNKKNIAKSLGMNPILVTALNREIGYEKAAHIAKKAYKENKSIINVAHEETGLSKAKLKVLLDPAKLTKGGV